MGKKKIKIKESVMSLIAVITVCALLGPFTKKLVNNHYNAVDGTWTMTREKFSDQTWEDYWKSIIDCPYETSDIAKAEAIWALNSGNANKSKEEVAQLWKAAGKPGYNAEKSNSSVVSANSDNNTEPKTKKTKATITLDESFKGNYVVTTKKAVYSTYQSSREEIGNIARGTEVEVTGNSSNGFYRFSYTKEDGSVVDGYLLYKNKDNIVTKEEYDAAWAETKRVEPTCEKDGYVQYTNSLSELKKKDALKATGHMAGEEITSKKATLFSKGEKIVSCTVCGKVLKSEEIDALIPVYMWCILGGVVAIFIVSGIYFIKSKKE
ncbi:MAG: hypothetical protein E7272_05880 [Pseudobutyrivibrio ruminis]|uniref:Uncharacterized protein n=1 Tax=Pseudobutyrivibrio ruminis TaxID=46206 RepID=A0A927UBC8_9FIRM|nr:hypothetical protein [Pseudobutyrivibrio ruminis]